MSLGPADQLGLIYVVARGGTPELPTDYVRIAEMTDEIDMFVKSKLADYDADKILSVTAISTTFYEMMEAGGALDYTELDIVGEYVKFDKGFYVTFRTRLLSEDPIYQNSKEIGDRYFPDAFDAIHEAVRPLERQQGEEDSDEFNNSQNIPASDRIVSLDHNRPEYDDIARGLDRAIDLADATRPNEVSGDEHASLVAGLRAARSYWDAFVLTEAQIRVGIAMAIERAEEALKTSFELVKGQLLMEAIKAFFKSAKNGDIF